MNKVTDLPFWNVDVKSSAVAMVDSDELVSIIMPCFNAAATMEDAIASVVAQTYENWELIIVDDASTDGSVDIVKRFAEQDVRVKYIFLTENVGTTAARNMALQKVTGRFVAFLDADDLWMPLKLEKQVTALKHSTAHMCCSSYVLMTNSGKRLPRVRLVRDRRYSYHQILANNVIGCLTVMVDTAKTGVFLFPAVKTVAEDFACWLQLLRHDEPRSVLGVSDVLATYRLAKNSRSSDKLKAARAVWQVLRYNEKLPLYLAAWYFSYYAVLRSPRLFERVFYNK